MLRISIVLPIYQTAQYLPELYARLTATLGALGDYEIVMVDDGSRDNAWEIMSALALKDQRVKSIRLSRNFGQHPAIAAGLEHATGDQIVLMDADLQDRPEDIPRLLEKLQGNIDVVYTVKISQSRGLLDKLTSRLYQSVFSQLSGLKIPQNHGTFPRLHPTVS